VASDIVAKISKMHRYMPMIDMAASIIIELQKAGNPLPI
jgi:hypothetical protein